MKPATATATVRLDKELDELITELDLLPRPKVEGRIETKMQPGDPASWMLFDGVETTPTVYSKDCYICNDDEFARMGLPLCYACPFCGGHVAADDSICDSCGKDAMDYGAENSE